MMTLETPLRHAGTPPALLQLPEPPDADNLGRLEQSVAELPGMLRRDLHRPEREAASIEYASWLRLLRARHG